MSKNKKTILKKKTFFVKTLTLTALIATTLIPVSAQAILFDRGNGMIYDSALNITWLQDANYAYTSGYAAANAAGGQNSGPTNIQANGLMGWDAANTWADQLEFGGYDGWRLPSANLIGNGNTPQCRGVIAFDGSCDFSYNNTTGELGHMFYNNLGNLAKYDNTGNLQPNYGITNTSFVDGLTSSVINILNFNTKLYWFSEEFSPNTDAAYAFNTIAGDQGAPGKYSSQYAWAVADGDIASVVPVPATAWLFGFGLLVLIIKYKRKPRT